MPSLSEFLAKHKEYNQLSFTASSEGGRVDQAVVDLVGNTSRSALRGLDFCATLNGKEAKPGVKLKAGDKIEAYWAKELEYSFDAEDVPFTVLHKDSDLMVIDKPWGIVVHPAKGHQSGTLANGVLKVLRDEGMDENFGEEGRVGIVHRLDKDTRGLMIVALNEESARNISDMFRNREIKKVYKAVIKGHLPELGIIELPIGRSPLDRKKMAIVPEGGREARTEYKTLRYFNGHSLVACNLLTGRTHQIRVHMAHMGCPVVGDILYGAKNKAPLPGMALVACHLKFKHPRTGKEMAFTLPDPPAFTEYLNSLKEIK